MSNQKQTTVLHKFGQLFTPFLYSGLNENIRALQIEAQIKQI